ncbi:E3 ubiquitin-protein ligase CHFR isoform X2 [Tripterygium wilfordii]|uniref:E3 ubiquitin-protein ligase CHFR isoform X2 n=2 Tax=Tripterygium wilfordii TaxID=458696 RepID=UPI0018F85E02|nr:E3 ubiquitin-protein ligase CHFR isoform X2 [Tripterygium wilfordii]
MEVGESSAAKMSSSDGEVWAKLVPSDLRYSDVEIMSNEVVICSEITSSSTEKHKWCKITRNSDLCSATIKNISSNSILVDEAPVQNEDDIVIKTGSDIVPDPDREGVLSYRFKLMPSPESQKQQIKVCIDFEHAKCSICLNIWHDVVTVAPCLHNFCNGCFSEWLRRSQEKHASVLCPHCRAIVQFVGRNHFLRNIEKDILQADTSLKRSEEEVALLDSYASIQSNLVIGTGKNHQRKRARTPMDVESDSLWFCPQCDTAFGGFRCNQSTIHLQCHACNGMMPSRTDITVPQHCLGCDRACCGAYWHAQRGMIGGDLHATCSHETFKPISQRTISQIPYLAHESNRHEQDVTKRCISQMGRTLQDIVSEWIAKLNNREIDRTRMPLNHAEMITAATHVCNECYDKLVSFLLYWFRISIPKHHLPPDVSNREDCWYGYACRTQHRSEEHARKRNHVCRPTRGGPQATHALSHTHVKPCPRAMPEGHEGHYNG